jgi:hypothetical protein
MLLSIDKARRNLATWNSAIYCARVACDTLIVSLR